MKKPHLLKRLQEEQLAKQAKMAEAGAV